MPESCSLKRKPKTDNLVVINLTVTTGKLVALINALETHGTPVAQDLRNMLIQSVKNDDSLSPMLD